ncbi:MAG TPA: flagellar export chaperone FliS [Bryobacteraceae bacterium]|nr:flagellar export chaperone FliS [Bryobacteraceae bacterium]
MSIQAYKNQQDWDILGASPLELVRALYRGAIQSVRAARTALANGEIRERSSAITKACAIVQELTVSLNKEIGGEVADNLAELYVYIHKRLGDANIEQIDAPLAEAERLLTILLDAWSQLKEEEPEYEHAGPLRLSA